MPDPSRGPVDILSVLAWPAGSASEQNPYVLMIYSAFDASEAKIVPFAPLKIGVPRANVFHIHWPEGIFEGRLGQNRLGATLKAWRVLRTAARTRKGGGIVALTVHNLTPHRPLNPWQGRLYLRFHRKLLRELDLLIGLSESGLEQYGQLYQIEPSTGRTIIPHPHYRDVYPNPTDRQSARNWFGLSSEDVVVGIIGSIRPSKGISEAIAAFRQVARPDERLLVAGRSSDGLWNELLAAAEADDRIVFRRGWLDDEALARAFSAIDICLINQSGTLNSGTALLALSFDRPIIAPEVGALPDLRKFVGEEWTELVQPPMTPGKLRSALDRLRCSSRQASAPLDELSPARLSEILLAAFKTRLIKAGRMGRS